MTEITITAQHRDYIREAKGLSLVESGAVELVGGTLALVRDAGMVYGADATGCGCGAAEDQGGQACAHQWAGRYAATTAEADGETAA